MKRLKSQQKLRKLWQQELQWRQKLPDEKKHEVQNWRCVWAGMPAQYRTMGPAAGGLLDWSRPKRPRDEELQDRERPRKQVRSVSQREPD